MHFHSQASLYRIYSFLRVLPHNWKRQLKKKLLLHGLLKTLTHCFQDVVVKASVNNYKQKEQIL